MIGNISTIDVKIDTDTFQITKLYAKDSYDLYLRCLPLLAPVFSVSTKISKKTGTKSIQENFDIEKINSVDFAGPMQQILGIITDKFAFDDVIRLLKASNIKQNYKEITDSDWNIASPLLIMELFAHVIKINVVGELLNSKKGIGPIATRLFGSKISLKNSEKKAS